MNDIPELRQSENHIPVDALTALGYGLSYPRTARREWGPRRTLSSPEDGDWNGRWVPRDEHGLWTGETAYYSGALMRDAYPNITLIDGNGGEHLLPDDEE